MDKRPMNLNLFSMRFPLTAWVSILHRMSGLLIFLFLPYLLWILQKSLSSADEFYGLQLQFKHPFLWLYYG